MSSLLDPSPVSAGETRYERAVYTGTAVVVAVAMFIAASGSGSGDYVTAEPPPDALNITGNVFAAVTGILVLIPKSRAIGAVLAVGNMVSAMYLNYTYDGVDYFVDLIVYNVATTILASILIGHYARDLTGLFGGRNDHAAQSQPSDVPEDSETAEMAR
ncbi:MAG: hypothetical protein AAGA42_15145 [Actinomycetota bacterium]